MSIIGIVEDRMSEYKGLLAKKDKERREKCWTRSWLQFHRIVVVLLLFSFWQQWQNRVGEEEGGEKDNFVNSQQ